MKQGNVTSEEARRHIESLKRGKRLDNVGDALEVLSTLEEQYLELARRHDELFHKAPVAIVTIDRAGRIAAHNDHAAEVVLPPSASRSVYLGSFIDPADRTAYVDFLARCWETEAPNTRDLRLIRPGESSRFARLSARRAPDSDLLCITIADIDDLKEIEGRLDAEARRSRALLRETNHRTKNLLQIIRSSLEIKARAATSDEARHVVQGLRSQVLSLQGAVNALSFGGDVSQIDAAELLTQIISHLSAGIHAGLSLEFDNQIGELPLGAEAGTSLSLVIAELCFNALEHAFPGNQAMATELNKIRVTLSREGDHVVATVTDNGIGFDGEPAGGGSLGLVIVRDLVENQLGGSIEWIPRHPGTEVHIGIPNPRVTKELQ